MYLLIIKYINIESIYVCFLIVMMQLIWVLHYKNKVYIIIIKNCLFIEKIILAIFKYLMYIINIDVMEDVLLVYLGMCSMLVVCYVKKLIIILI